MIKKRLIPSLALLLFLPVMVPNGHTAEPAHQVVKDILAAYGVRPQALMHPALTAIRSTNEAVRVQACRDGLVAGYSFGELGFLHMAALLGAREAVEHLLDLGVSPDERKHDRLPTALHLAILAGDETTALLLLEHGAQPGMVIGQGRSALSLAVMLGHAVVAEAILARGLAVDHADGSGMTPLSAAAKGGQTAMAKWLIQQGANVNSQDVHGLTPLHIAVLGDHQEIVQLLLAAHADQGLADHHGRIPVWLAVRLVRLEALRALLKQPAFMDIAAPNGQSPLLTALRSNRRDLLAVLAEFGVDLTKRYEQGQTLLHLAVNMNATNSVMWLAENTDLNGQDEQGYTPLARAVEQNKTGLVRILINAGADVNLSLQSGFSPLLLAIRARNNSLVHQLLHAGASANTSRPNGETAAMLAAAWGNRQLLEMLFDAGASGEGFTDRGHGIFDFALVHAGTENMKFLLEKNLDPTLTHSADKWPVILTAVWDGRRDVVEALLDHGVDVNTVDRSGQTLLMVAVRRGHVALARSLIQRGGDVTLRMSSSLTAWHLAKDRYMLDFAEELAVQMSPEQRAPTNRITVFFDLDAPLATNVFVAGFFNEWNSASHPMRQRDDDGWWYTEVEVFPVTYKYKFVVDNTWILDPESDQTLQDHNAGYVDSVFHAPDRTPDKRPTRLPASAHVYKEVTFDFTSTEAHSVSVAGEFNGWNTRTLVMTKRPNGTWKATTRLKPGVYGYKLVVDNEWRLDPDNPKVKVVDGVTNSLIRVPD